MLTTTSFPIKSCRTKIKDASDQAKVLVTLLIKKGLASGQGWTTYVGCLGVYRETYWGTNLLVRAFLSQIWVPSL